MGVVKVKKGNEVFEIQDTDLKDAVKDGYLPTDTVIVANSKTKEMFEIAPEDLPDAFSDGFDFSGVKKKVGGIGSSVGGAVGTSVPQSEEDRIASLLKTVGRSSDQSPLPQEAQPEFDRNDPVRSIYAPVRNKLATLRQRPVAESVAQDPLQKQQRSKEISDALNAKAALDRQRVFQNTGQAVNFLQQKLDNSKLVPSKPIDIMQRPTLDDFTEESILDAAKGNETLELATKKYLENKKVKESIYSSNSLDEAAVKLAALKGDLTSKQIQALNGNIPKSMQANLLIGLLNDENTQELAENDAELKSKILETAYNLPDKYPQAAATYLAQVLSQERENRGLNNAVLNFSSIGTNDDIVKDLVEKGKLPVQYQNLYNNPAIKFYINRMIKTPGIVENVVGGVESGITGFGKSTKETGILGSTIDNSKQELYNALEKDYQQVGLKPKSLLHDITMTGGNIVGQIIPTAAAGNYLQAAKIITNPALANSIGIGLQTYGDYKEQARKELPDAGEMKQTAYALSLTGIEMATENIVNDTKLAKQALSKYKPEIQDVIEKFTAKEISREAAKSKVNDIFSRVLENAKSFAAKTGKIAVGEANEEAAASILQNATNQVFGGEEKSLPQVANEAFDVWKTTLLGGLPLGAIGGISAMNKNKPARELIYEVAGNPEKYIPLVQEQSALNEEYAAKSNDILSNIDYAAKVRQALDQRTDLTEAQKKRFLVASINEKNLQGEAAKIPDPTLRQPIEKEIEKAVDEKQKALTEVEIDQDRDLMDAEGDLDAANKIQKAIEDGTIKGANLMSAQAAMSIDGGVEMFMKEIADQAQDKSTEFGSKNRETAIKNYGQDLVDLAVKLYPKEEIISEKPSISVQMPEDVKKPEIVEEDVTPFIEATRPEIVFDEIGTDILDNMDSKTMAVQGKRLEGVNKNLGKLKELFDCIWT